MRRPGRAVRRRRRRRSDDRPRDDGRRSSPARRSPRPTEPASEATRGLGARVLVSARLSTPTGEGLAARSAQRSSTSSMPTERRSRLVGHLAGLGAPSGAGAPGSTRRRRATWCGPRGGSRPATAVGGVGATGEQDRRPSRRSPGSGPRRRPGGRRAAGPARRRWPGPAPSGRAGCAGRAVASQASRVPGDGAEQVAAALEHVPERVVGGDDRAHQQVAVAAEVLRRRVHDDVGAERRAAAGAGGWRRCCRRRPWRRPRARPRRWSRCRRARATGWWGTPATPARRRRRSAATNPAVSSMSTSRVVDAVARLEVGELEQRAVVGDPRRDHGGAVGHEVEHGRDRGRGPRRTPGHRPPSRSPSAASKACQVGLPVRPYSRSPPATYVEAIVIGVLSGWSGSCGRAAGVHGAGGGAERSSAMPTRP